MTEVRDEIDEGVTRKVNDVGLDWAIRMAGREKVTAIAVVDAFHD